MKAVMGAMVAALALAGSLAGCTTPDAAAPTTAPTATSTAVAEAAVVPVVPEVLDAASAERETERVADAIQALVDPSQLVHVDDHAQLVDATAEAGEFYGVLRTATLEQPTDPVALAQEVTGVLAASGWTTNQTSDEGGIYLTALSQNGWFVLVGGDLSVPNQSVLTLQLASPDVP